jgi:N-methylhydantoinase A
MDAIPAEPAVTISEPAQAKGQRRAYLGDWIDVPVFDMDALNAGQNLSGPAIVESRTTTILLNHGDTAVVTDTGWLDIAVHEAASIAHPAGSQGSTVLEAVAAGAQ